MINSGDGDDTVNVVKGIYNTINGGLGNDYINIKKNTGGNIYKYYLGEGKDTIFGFGENDTLQIINSKYSILTSGEDLKINIGDGSILLKNAATIAVNIEDYYEIYNADSNVSIFGTSDADSISNTGDFVIINGEAGNDAIYSYGNKVYINGGEGNDKIYNDRVQNHIAYDDTINDSLTIDDLTIDGGIGDDSIYNEYGDNTSIIGGTGNDYIYNYIGNNVTIDAGAGDDSIYNYGDNVTIDGGAGNDYIDNSWNNNVTIDAGAGDDSIYNYGDNVTIDGGAGDDVISINSDSSNNLIQYANGDGNDSITGLDSNDTLQISGAEYTTTNSGSDLIICVENDSITVVGGVNAGFTIDGTLKSSGSENETLPTGISVKNSIVTAAKTFTGNEIDLANYLSTVTKVNASALSKAVSITGNDSANSIKGGKGADTISGGAGNDTLTGGAGKDIFIYSAGNDIITDYKSGEDIISATYTNSTVKGSDVILTTADGNLTVKGAKDKVITFDDGNELIFFSNTSYAPLATGLTYDAKRTVLTASNKFTGTEIDLANYLSTVTKVNASALSKAVEITGNDNDNSIKGGKGADTISGGAGNDTLTGGNGKDTFIYSTGKDVITDYAAGDEIQIDGKISNTSYSGKNVIFTVGNGSLTVQNGKGKDISVTDSSGSKTYSRTLDILYDNNFISDDTNLDSITEEKFSVTEIQNYNSDTFAQDENILTFAKEK